MLEMEEDKIYLMKEAKTSPFDKTDSKQCSLEMGETKISSCEIKEAKIFLLEMKEAKIYSLKGAKTSSIKTKRFQTFLTGDGGSPNILM